MKSGPGSSYLPSAQFLPEEHKVVAALQTAAATAEIAAFLTSCCSSLAGQGLSLGQPEAFLQPRRQYSH